MMSGLASTAWCHSKWCHGVARLLTWTLLLYLYL